tara:strand:+ start:21634 stop:22233 length:600 start_codon:yes stop_codon:yes gene_type:complete
VKLIAVSKKQPVDKIRTAIAAGQRAFGENYAQEALDKIAALKDEDVEWHFIGPIQSNKTRLLAAHFAWVHSVCRLDIAQRLNDQRPSSLAPLNICLQINTSGEASKSGVSVDEAHDLAHAIVSLPHLKLRGLMTIPAPCDDFDEQRRPYHQLQDLFLSLHQQGILIDTLSMGMTNDFEAAIAEGATMIRVGTAVFGERE